jgi:hypothetical protein
MRSSGFFQRMLLALQPESALIATVIRGARALAISSRDVIASSSVESERAASERL